MRIRYIGKIARKGIAGVMAVWLSGVVFLFCCHTTQAAAAVASCPMRAAHHCDGDRTKADSNVVTTGSCSCVECGYLPVVFDKARKLEAPQKHIPTPVPAPVAGIPFIASVPITPRAPAPRQHVRDKSRTFISTQVFRC